MLNKYEKLTEPHKIISNIFDNINAGMEAGKKPADKAIEELNEVSYISRLEREVKQLKNILKGYRFETATLKKSLSKAGELIEELKKENKSLKRKLRRFDEIFNNFESKRKELNNQKGEIDHDHNTNNQAESRRTGIHANNRPAPEERMAST